MSWTQAAWSALDLIARLGPVVTFCHGWPLRSDAWDGQMLFLAQKGFRVFAHDRR